MFACTIFTHGFSPSEALICSLLGILMMIVSNSARVPWAVFTNILLLGLVVYRADSGSSDGGFDFDDGGMDADLPDDSIWAGVFGFDAAAAHRRIPPDLPCRKRPADLRCQRYAGTDHP